ncbi:hypothetical protein [Arthrobacter sp. EM1]|uniref:hypothetical protein n=2 Tax=unclassified Arthrobacter TaxID=235627 RepID=UPI00249EF85A|nr:hypothetical protein [Arthrobacter sp. EM1]WGZ78478.1 hypothetical protein QI450_11375 [Arthrobacter sp. EM1]
MGSKGETGPVPAAGGNIALRRAHRGRRGSRAFLALAVTAALAGCSVGVPDPAAAKPTPLAPTVDAPTVTPGHDSAAVAAKDMPFAAGESLAAGVPVRLSDALGQAPGWKPGKQEVAGGSEYLKGDGCLVSAKSRVNQGVLAVAGSDKASTEALFRYLDPSILPSYLTTVTLRWGADPDKPAPGVEMLVLESGAKAGARASAVYARLFSKAGNSVYISVSCPDAGTLTAARANVAEYLGVIPPSD